MAWTNIAAVSSGDVITSIWGNSVIGNLQYLLNPNNSVILRDNRADYTTTSTTFVDIDSTNLSITLTTNGGPVLLFFGINYLAYGGVMPCLDIAVDGTRIGNAFTYGLVKGQISPVNSDVSNITYATLKTGLSAASHTFKLQWRAYSSGTSTIKNNGDYPVLFGAIEL